MQELTAMLAFILTHPTLLHSVEVEIARELQGTWERRCVGCRRMIRALHAKVQRLLSPPK